MANGQVKIHDPISDHNDLNRDCDPETTSNTGSVEDSVEFRILMAYAQRRGPQRDAESPPHDRPVAPNDGTRANGPTTPEAPAEAEKQGKKKKKKGLKRLSSLLGCIKPQTEDKDLPQTITLPPEVNDRCMNSIVDDREEDELEEAVSKLTELASEIQFLPPEVETDSPDDVEKVIALLLRDAGDRLNDRELKDALTARDLFWNYAFFKIVIKTLLRTMGLVAADPEALGPHASLKTQIAVTCEVTTRLSVVDTLPMNRMLRHGARYLQDHYSSWAQQQGGYEEAFDSDDDVQ